MIEIKIPREVIRGPKAMEQFFYNLYSLRNAPGNLKEWYLDGEVTRWFCLEVVGHAQTTRFFMRIPSRLKSTITSMLYGAYNEIEIIDAEDYIYSMPPTYSDLVKAGMELFGMVLHLRNKSPFPMRTYDDFEDQLGEERTIDPISVILEIVGNLKPEETLWLQILIAPAGDGWRKEGHALVDIMKRKGQVDLKAAATGGKFTPRSPGEDLDMKNIEEKISKPGFDTIIRYIYIAPKAIYNKELPERGVYAAFNQMASGLNQFRKNQKIQTKTAWFNWPYFWPRIRMWHRRFKVYEEYRQRFFNEDTFIGQFDHSTFFRLNFYHKRSVLSTAELATMFHPPTNVVMTSVTMDRVESKRLSPPANLPG